MKVIKIINTIIIVTIISVIAIPILVILFPIITIVELMCFIDEVFTENKYKHNIFASIVFSVIEYIQNTIKSMMED